MENQIKTEKSFIATALNKIGIVLFLPVGILYVTTYALIHFTKMFLQGYYVEHILQILFIKLQNDLPKLVHRAKWFAPFVYAYLIYHFYTGLSFIFHLFI